MLKDLLSLFFVFFKIGSITFGGGLAMLPILEHELIKKRNWVSSRELIDYYAIGQSTPGIIAVNVATFVGHKRRGIIGAVVSTLGIVTPSVIIISLIALFISNFESIQWVQKALKGINISVAALLTIAAVKLCSKTVTRWYSAVFYASAFSAVYFFHVHTVFVILTAVLTGLILFFAGRKKGGEK